MTDGPELRTNVSKRVLVPFDGSEPAEAALELAVDLHDGAEIVMLYVLDPMIDYSRRRAFPGYTMADEYKNERERAEALLEKAEQKWAEKHDRLETDFAAGSPAREIVRYVEENDVDHVVMGSHGRKRAARILLGSVAETVTRRSPVPVTIVR